MRFFNKRNSTKQNNSCFLLFSKVKGLNIWISYFLAFLLLIAEGWICRTVGSLTTTAVVNLPVALKNIPVDIGDWIGSELEIPITVKTYMETNFADDYISRRYVNNQTQSLVDLYIVYCASRPGGMLGHQPQVCYPGNGWIQDSIEQTQFTTEKGREIKCLIHKFHKPAPGYEQTVVLNFFIVNGKLTITQEDFRGVLSRGFNLKQNPARYAAQVQIGSVSESAVLNAASEMSDFVLDFLPDEDGEVAVADSVTAISN